MLTSIGYTLKVAWDSDKEHKSAFAERVKWLREDKGWSRKDLDRISGVPARTIIDVENGEKAVLDRRTVCLLAQAFGLVGLAERDFVSLAGLRPDALSASQVPALLADGFVRRFYQDTQLPAYIANSLFDLHSCNSYLLAMFGLSHTQLESMAYNGAGPNILRFLFDPAFVARAAYGQNWATRAVNNVYLFRAMSHGHEHTPRYTELLSHLRRLPGFNQAWHDAEQLSAPPVPPYTHEVNTAFGSTYVLHGEAVLPAEVQLFYRASFYVPMNAETEQTYARLRNSHTKSAVQFSNVALGLRRFSKIF